MVPYPSHSVCSKSSGAEWYLNEADSQMWSVRALDRNISTQYFERRLSAMRQNTALPAPANEGFHLLTGFDHPIKL